MHRSTSLASAVLSTLVSCAYATAPKNVILFVGDGMGEEAVKAAGYYFNGASGEFNFEQFSGFAWMTHNTSTGIVTDSAASATAMATGFKVNTSVISQAYATGPDPRSATPSDGRDLQTLLEVFKAQGKSTGLVTTSYMTDATPAAFGAHTDHRSNTATIASNYFNNTQPNVLFGGGGSDFAPTPLYTTVTDRASLESIDTESATHVAGVFGTGEFAYAYDQHTGASTFYNANPYLHELTGTALSVLDNNANGFFLMVENELTDGAGHAAVSGASKAEKSIFEVRELSRAVQKAIDFAAANPDTLILVTGDHETGSFRAIQNNGIGVMPTVTSGGTRHNATWLPLYASGPTAGNFFGKLDNTDIPMLATSSDQTPAPSVQTLRFRDGEDGYDGTTDTGVTSAAPTTVNGAATALLADNASPTAQVAIRFDNILDNIPDDATILLAKLSVYTDNVASGNGTNNSILLNRLLVPFDNDTTYNNAGLVASNGFSLNGAGTADDDFFATPEDVFPAPDRNSTVTFDVTESLMTWLAAYRAGEAHSFGWVLSTSGTDGWQMTSSEFATLASRPMLEITFVPEPATALVPLVGALAMLRRVRQTR